MEFKKKIDEDPLTTGGAIIVFIAIIGIVMGLIWGILGLFLGIAIFSATVFLSYI